MNCWEAIDLMGDAMEGVLAPEPSAGLFDHLEECPPCRNYFEQLQLTRRALRNLGHPEDPNRKRRELLDRFKDAFRKHH